MKIFLKIVRKYYLCETTFIFYNKCSGIKLYQLSKICPVGKAEILAVWWA